MIPIVFALLLIQDKAVVEGTVLNALTNEPLKKARVVLDEGSNQYAVTSSSEGKFQFEGLEPGEYHLEASRQGFLDSDYEPSWFKLSPGDHVKDIVIKMTPQGIIAGHVLDEDGDPVPELVVHAARTIHVNGRAVVLGTAWAMTDNEGYFLLSELQAGRYYLSAEPSRHPGEVSKPGHPGNEEDFVRSDDPVPRDITAGAALRNVVVHIRKSAVYRIRGSLTYPPKQPLRIRLAPPDGNPGANNDPQASPRDGVFEFAGIAPGNYLLMIDTAGLYSRVPITVADQNIDDITVDLTPGPTIEGTLKMEGDGHFAKPQTVQLAGNFPPNLIVVKEDGTFGWTNLAPKGYVIDYGPPEGYYVKSIQFNHQPVNNLRIDLTSGAGGTLDLVVAPNAASLSITVEGAKTAQVALWNDSALHTRDTEANGTASFEHLAPGEYRILAWQKVDPQFVSIPEFRARFDAQKVTLAEGAHENIELKLIPKSATDAEIAKLQ
ncbi:MAG TPA: carboxypeptidase-like regulatory domain-containing protein [Bryobacteraceae bacterium]|jgi:hypothetical protein|nr:carboxypeptidase-like regulatory domain-containing protein [Bryobacteraceae bacterium]